MYIWGYGGLGPSLVACPVCTGYAPWPKLAVGAAVNNNKTSEGLPSISIATSNAPTKLRVGHSLIASEKDTRRLLQKVHDHVAYPILCVKASTLQGVRRGSKIVPPGRSHFGSIHGEGSGYVANR